MAILLTYASKHGSTQGIAACITEKLRELGKDVELQPLDAVKDLGTYEAVVIGSAIYYGYWLKEAVEFIRRNQAELATRPVWLFSSGPTGVEVKDAEQQPQDLEEFQRLIEPRGHQTFFGALDHKKLSFAERMLCKALRAPEGDFRDWNAISAWAAEIAQALAPIGVA